VRLLNAADDDVERATAMRYDPPARRSPDFRCPKCGKGFYGISQPSECPRCEWLRFPGDRAAWGTAGACRRCGFSHRWDGERCSHCGLNADEVRLTGRVPLVRLHRRR
jgi:rubrerythrin